VSNVVGQIDTFLKQKGSPLAGLGNVFVAAGKKYGVDPRLLVSISGIESSFGKYVPTDSHNAWGWGPGHPFPSWQAGISAVAQGLKTGYIDQGLVTPAEIVGKYSPASAGNDETTWSNTVSEFMHELGATPAAAAAKTVITPAMSTVPTTPKTRAPSMPTLDTSGIESTITQLRQPVFTGVRNALIGSLGEVASTGGMSGTDLLSGLVTGRAQDLSQGYSNSEEADQLAAGLKTLKVSAVPKTPKVAVVPTSPQPSSASSTTAIHGVKPGNPIPTRDLTSVGPLHPTEGLPGYPAHDYMAPAGSPVVAPVTGTIVRLSGHNPDEGPTEGAHGPFGWSIYVKGTNGHTYYLTHLGTRDVQVGEKIQAGQKIATVGNYAKWTGTPDHVHMGVSETTS
jgi:murein DD-endopeptidase MepM/ murein hydrolase activator NlpD